MKILLLLAIIVALCASGSDACQSCLAELTRGLLLGDNSGIGKQHHHQNDHRDNDKHQHFAAVAPITSSLPLVLRKPMLTGRGLSGTGVDASVIGFLTIRKCIAAVAHQRRCDNSLERNTLMIQQQHDALLQQKRDNSGWIRTLFASESKDDYIEKEEEDGDAKATNDSSGSEVMSSSMIMAIGFYKKVISPLLPPACRFLPTCSQYGVQAIEKYGPQKGLILTAWRLARCSPLGGKGYDPPVWPPVSYTYGSY